MGSVKHKRIVLALVVAGLAGIVPAGIALSQVDPEQPTLGPEEPAAVPELTAAALAAVAGSCRMTRG